MRNTRLSPVFVIAALALASACGGGKPVATPKAPPLTPAPFPTAGGSAVSVPPPSVPAAATVDPLPPIVGVPANPTVTADPMGALSAEQINQQSPLQPTFFAFDSDSLDETARKTLADDAEILKRYGSWVVSIEGHSDERGTAEYNLALGERRALAAKSYLVSLGIPADRLRTVSYGKEFPFDTGHDESAWSKNRRAHFMVTANK